MTMIAYDGSGSTGNVAFYHDEVQRIVASLPDDSKILFWDTASRLIPHTELAEINKRRQGGGGTEPATIARYVSESGFNGDLIIITDGQVGSIAHVDACLPPNAKFNSVVAYLIHTGGQVNMSVACPFTRRSPHQVYLYGPDQERRLVVSASAADLAIISRIQDIGTIEEFEAAAPALEKAIVAATMGSTGDPTLRDSLLTMKARIMRTEARVKGDSDTVRALNAALDGHHMANAVSLARILTEEYYGDEAEDPDAVTWSARLSRFVSMTEGALRSTFDLSGISSAIRGDRARRAPTAASVATPQMTDGSVAFECPITCDTEADVVLLNAYGEPLLTGVDKDIANSLYDCPLNLLNHPTLVAALKERLDHPISLRAFQEAHAAGHPFDTSPMTRRPVSAGAICLGPAEDHCRATAWPLAQLMTGGKLVGNQDFWFACIWLLVERGEIPYLTPILPQLRAHMQWRLTHHQSSVSLTGLPEYPTARVPLRTALWYVFASAEFGMLSRRDVLRAHLPHLTALGDLLTLTGLTVSNAVKHHIIRLRTMLSMLSWVKRARHELPNLMLALTQMCVEVDPAALRMQFESMPRFIPIDGAPTEIQVARVMELLPASFRALSVAEIVGLAALVDPSKSAGDIELPLTWAPPPLRAPTLDGWPLYGLRAVPDVPVKLCPATCRPYYYVNSGDTWFDDAEKCYGFPFTKPSNILSANQAHGDFVVRYGVYPTPDELLTYLYNRRVIHGSNTTLPHVAAAFVMGPISDAGPLMATLTPAEFGRRFRASVAREDRIAMESQK